MSNNSSSISVNDKSMQEHSENKKFELLSIGEASEYLGISIDTLRRWEKKGRIVPMRSPGGHRYYNKTDLENLFGKRYTREENDLQKQTTPDVSSQNTEEIDKIIDFIDSENTQTDDISLQDMVPNLHPAESNSNVVETTQTRTEISLPSWRAVKEEITIKDVTETITEANKTLNDDDVQKESADISKTEIKIPSIAQIRVLS